MIKPYLATPRANTLFQRLAPHDHACLVYADPKALLRYVDQFTLDGEMRDRMTVFVHAFPSNEEALAWLREGEVDYDRLLGHGFFLVSYHREAFEGASPRIDHEHVAEFIADLMRVARESNRSLGIIVDASRRYLASGREEEWFRFEEWLGTRLREAASLVCMYRDTDVAAPERKARMLRTHLYRFGG